MTACNLAGLGVLVTRPAHQAEGLCRLIEECGGHVLRFPALEILPPRDATAARALLAGAWDLVLFVSPNAVHQALALSGGLPGAASLGAVGKGTARALAAVGRPAELVPEQFDSEGLLSLPALQSVSGQRVLIVRGEGGRALLGETLAQRGAEVKYAEVYRRVLPAADPAPLLARWGREVRVVTATSSELLENLARLLGEAGRERLTSTPLVVISERMEAAAARLGIGRVIRAAGADDRSLVEALCGWVGRAGA